MKYDSVVLIANSKQTLLFVQSNATEITFSRPWCPSFIQLLIMASNLDVENFRSVFWLFTWNSEIIKCVLCYFKIFDDSIWLDACISSKNMDVIRRISKTERRVVRCLLNSWNTNIVSCFIFNYVKYACAFNALLFLLKLFL